MIECFAVIPTTHLESFYGIKKPEPMSFKESETPNANLRSEGREGTRQQEDMS